MTTLSPAVAEKLQYHVYDYPSLALPFRERRAAHSRAASALAGRTEPPAEPMSVGAEAVS